MTAGSPVRDICGISAIPTIKATAASLARTGALVRTVMVKPLPPRGSDSRPPGSGLSVRLLPAQFEVDRPSVRVSVVTPTIREEIDQVEAASVFGEGADRLADTRCLGSAAVSDFDANRERS